MAGTVLRGVSIAANTSAVIPITALVLLEGDETRTTRGMVVT